MELVEVHVEFVARDSSTDGEIRLRQPGRSDQAGVEIAKKSPENLAGGEEQI